MMKRLSVSLALVIFLTSYAQSPQTLPDLVLKDVNGKNKNISDYSKSGKVTVISFWATWCTPCKKELTNINDNLLETWREKYNVTLVAVSIDNAKNVLKVKPYVDGQAWDFDVLLDVNEDLKRALNVNNVPYTILLDKKGNIVWKHEGYVEGNEYILDEQVRKYAEMP
ncbi:MAG: TlpA family protein disulfide reductase [Bacteroidota bacterium]|jgi:cytochrome c biogenesis protein CcmG/thiol:disulfide interchange protein DsbE